MSSPAHFDTDLKDLHLIYAYDVTDPQTGAREEWEYEAYFPSADRVVYAIHGGPMAGRKNYQTCQLQCIRPGELWQVNWLEETGTICSAVYDLKENKVATLIAFSKGHWEQAEQAHGDKRNEEDFKRWRRLAEVGKQTDRHMLSETGRITRRFKGPGELGPFEHDWPTL